MPELEPVTCGETKLETGYKAKQKANVVTPLHPTNVPLNVFKTEL